MVPTAEPELVGLLLVEQHGIHAVEGIDWQELVSMEVGTDNAVADGWRPSRDGQV